MIGMMFINSCFCSSSPEKQFIRYKAFTKKEFSSTSSVKKTRLSDRRLYRQGYKKIGLLSVSHLHKRCYKECENFQHEHSSMDVLLEEAMERGAQLIKISASNRPKKEPWKKRLKCLSYRTITYNFQGTTPDGRSTRETRSYQECIKWQYGTGIQTMYYSSGSLWRKR